MQGGYGAGWPPAPGAGAGFNAWPAAGMKRTAADAFAPVDWQQNGYLGNNASAFSNAVDQSAAGWPAQDNGYNSGWNSGGRQSSTEDNGYKSSWNSYDATSSWKQPSADSSWTSDWKNQSNSWNQASNEVEEDVDVEAQPHGFAFLQPATPFSEGSQQDVQAARQATEVVVKGEAPGLAVAPITSFSALSNVLPEYVTTSLAQNGIVAPVPIQQHTLPFTLRGFDLIGIAKTGSGKTLAFLLPAIAHAEMQAPMPDGQSTPSTIILAPVRELAAQICEEAVKILWHSGSSNHPKGIGCVAVYGGGGEIRRKQLGELKQGYSQMIVGTPGRVADFIQSGDLVLNRVVFFVLDEADRMLEGGFEDQMNEIAAKVAPNRQTLFFSATWPMAVRKLAKNMCRAPPIRVSVGQCADDAGHGPTARSDIMQEVIVFDGGPRRPWPDDVVEKITEDKTNRMNSHLRMCLADSRNKVLVFVNTKNMAWELAEQLQKEGFSADYMTSNRSQTQRQEVVQWFKEGKTKLVVTTDVMARGLDIPGITHVVVYDCYGGIDDYVHRIGRTSRGFDGVTGHALIFYEFDPKYAQMPADIIALLQNANQTVPPDLQMIADQVASGVRKAVHGTQKKKQKKW